MNTHEIERIAAAMNHLRPDWPIRQLKTLLTDARITDRPRRDVTVALAWVACESGTANPYRVLEAGPWWRAAAVDGAAKSPNKVPADRRCSTCSLDQSRCRQIWSGDHDFELDFKTKRDGETVHQIVTAVRAEVAPTPTIAEPKRLDDLLPEQRDPRVMAARAALTTTEPHATGCAADDEESDR